MTPKGGLRMRLSPETGNTLGSSRWLNEILQKEEPTMIRKPGLALFVASIVCPGGLIISSQAMAQVATASLNGTV